MQSRERPGNVELCGTRNSERARGVRAPLRAADIRAVHVARHQPHGRWFRKGTGDRRRHQWEGGAAAAAEVASAARRQRRRAGPGSRTRPVPVRTRPCPAGRRRRRRFASRGDCADEQPMACSVTAAGAARLVAVPRAPQPHLTTRARALGQGRLTAGDARVTEIPAHIAEKNVT